MAKKDLKENLKKMESSGYFSEDVKIDKDALGFDLSALEKDDDEEDKKKKDLTKDDK